MIYTQTILDKLCETHYNRFCDRDQEIDVEHFALNYEYTNTQSEFHV